jgi:phosphocarrier protein HPr
VAERVITVSVPEGLHARPAAELVRLAHEHPGPVEVRAHGREPVDAASILGVMTLGVDPGESVVVAVQGPGADARLDRIAALLDPA